MDLSRNTCKFELGLGALCTCTESRIVGALDQLRKTEDPSQGRSSRLSDQEKKNEAMILCLVYGSQVVLEWFVHRQQWTGSNSAKGEKGILKSHRFLRLLDQGMIASKEKRRGKGS